MVMSDFLGVMGLVFRFLKSPFTVYGFTFSFFDIFVFMIITGIAITFLRLLFGD